MISFVLGLKGDERIDSMEVAILSSIIIMEVRKQMGSYIERNG